MAIQKWHVNKQGKAGRCSAKVECPFGGDEQHFDTKFEAQQFYERTQQKSLFNNTLTKPRKSFYKFVATGGVLLTAVSLVGCDTSIQVNDEGDVGITIEGEDIWFETEEPTTEESDEPTHSENEDSDNDNSTSSAPDSLEGALWQGEELRPSSSEVQEAKDLLNSLDIAEELNRDGDYDRDEMFGGWQSGTVEEIQARDLPFAEFGDNGKAVGGYMMDPYTGEEVIISKENTSDIDTEHIVPVKEIVESERIVVNTDSEAEALKQDPQLIREYVQQGEATLTDEEISEIESNPELLDDYYLDADEKREIANDPTNLTMVSSSANRSRGDRDVAEWLPDYEPAHCTFVVSQIQVKSNYNLSVDSAEEAVMRDVLDNKCD